MVGTPDADLPRAELRAKTGGKASLDTFVQKFYAGAPGAPAVKPYVEADVYAALNSVVASLAREGGLPSIFWAGPETISRGVRQGIYPVEPLAKRKVASLKLGFGGDSYGYSIDLGYPPPPPPATMFELDPHVKRECIWHGAGLP